MEIGIIGLPGSGKTTVFNVLAKEQAKTGAYSSSGVKANLGVVEVPDERLDYIANIYNPKKTVYARINYIDIAGLGGGDRFAVSDKLVQADALAIVLRAFEDTGFPHPAGSIDALRDLKDVESEILLSDLINVERRIESLDKFVKRGVKERIAEYEIFMKCKEHLEKELPLRELTLTNDEHTLLHPYALLTKTPLIVIVNIGEEDIVSGGSEQYKKVCEFLDGSPHTAVTEISGKIEMELSSLSTEEQQEFKNELGIGKSGFEEITQVSYNLLDLISFFTYGEDECRAWTIRNGTVARAAAGKIHTDLERGFIRAEVIAYGDFVTAEGSINKVKEMGRFRLEGKEYMVKDGDIFIVRFQV